MLLFTGPVAIAQLSGAYTINSAQATAGTNYASFTAAATALTTGGVSGPVTFTVSGGPYTEQVKLNAITGASAVNRVTFNGGGRTIQFGSTIQTQQAVFTLDGADYVTVNNLMIDATVGGTSTATYGWGVQLVNNADNNVISNCTITASTAATATSVNFAGIVSSASTTLPTASGATANQNLTISGNTITGGYYGIAAVGNTTASPSQGLVISNNTVWDFYNYGIYLGYQTGAQVISNDIARPTRAVVSGFFGIYLTTGFGGGAIEKNRIHNASSGNLTATNTSYGMFLTTSTAATVAAPTDIINNVIYNLDGSGTTYGFYNGSSNNIRYYHNTVNLDDQATTGSGDTYGYFQNGGLNVEFRNNVVQVSRVGTGAGYALYHFSAAPTAISNNNDLSGSGPNYQTAYYGGTAYPTLASWRTANGGTFDLNSLDIPPFFVSAATGNLRPTSGALHGSAAVLARVTQDITGAPRSATPDMGAYEFTPVTDDVAVLSIDSPTSPIVAGNRSVMVTIRNNGSALLNTVRLEYVLNGGAAVGQTFTLAGGLAAGTTRALTFTTPALLVTGTNTLTVTGSLPNGNADPNAANNTRTVILYPALAGTYTINKLLPTGGTNFASFTAAAAALNGGGIAASVRLNVLNGPYTNEQFALGVIAGASTTDTVVVDGGASKQTLAYTGIAGASAAVLLNGTDYVTLQNLTIDASAGTTYGIGVQLVGQANSNRILNCVVMGSATGTSNTASAGIAASGAIAAGYSAGDANNLRVENNVISGGFFGVVLFGASTTARSTGIRVLNNEIRDFYYYGLDVENATAAQLVNNNIHRSTRTSGALFYGVYLAGCASTAVERNRIHDTFTLNLLNSSTAYGIYFSNSDGTAGAENDVVNNLLYNFNGIGTEYGIYNNGSDYARYYHNTISLDNQAFTGTALSYGFYQTTLAVGIDFRNNLLSLTRTGTGNRFALYFPTTTSTITSNYNDLYLGTGTNFFTGYYGTTSYATLANWRTANTNAYDQNSIQAWPRFAAPAAGDLHPTTTALDGTGLTLARVPRDFASVLRTSPPDVGAYEFTPINYDVALVSIDSPTTPATPGVNPLTVTIRNDGNLVLSAVTLSYTLNGGPAITQVFSGLSLAAFTSQQLTFTPGVTITLSGTNSLTVTASLPNGQPDATAANNSQTITFIQPTPANDEPCAAVPLSTSVLTSSTSGATTSGQNGIITPVCAGGALPKDVWFTFTPSGTSTTLTLTGAPAGAIRVFSSPSCSAGLFTQVFCQGSGTANTAFAGPVTVAGLTAGTRYYVAVSGYSSGEVGGSFTISATAILATRSSNNAVLAVFPNPSATGQLTLRLATATSAGSVELLNTLGQTVRQMPLTGTTEQRLSTLSLKPGLYTLRVQMAGEVLTRKVVLQ